MSIVNLLAHLYGYHRIYKHSYRYIPIKTTWILHEPIRLIFFSSTNAWIWSTIFHTRDTPGTMVMDYLSAIGLILANLNFAINLYFGFKSRTAQFITFISLFSLWIFHSFYMICFKFDFNWNMQFAIMLGSFYSLLMITWSLKNLEYVFDHAKKGEDEMDFKRLGKKKRSHAFCSFFATVALICVAGFEIFDFPPILWGLFDAHALWHTFTPPIILLNYYFYGRELRFQLS